MGIPTIGADPSLLVIHRGALGDVLASLPFLAALPGHFQARCLNLVGNPSSLGLLTNLPFVAGINDFDQATWAGLYLEPPQVGDRLEQFIRSHTAGVIMARRPDDPLAAALKRLGLVRVVVAPSRPPEASGHLLDHIFSVTGVAPPEVFPTLPPPPAGLERARELVRAAGLNDRPWVTIHPGSSAAEKNWPLASWMELADRLIRERGVVPLFLLGPAEAKIQVELTAHTARQVANKWTLVAGESLAVVAGIISLGLVHLGADTGPTHLATALGRPTIAVFGSTDPGRWAPRGPRVRVVRPGSGGEPGWPRAWPQVDDIYDNLLDMLGDSGI